MDNKIDWSKIDKKRMAEIIALKYIEIEKRRHERFTNYWRYQIFTPWYIKLWHKLTFKKTPKL